MASVYDFPDRAAIEQEAGEWLIRLDSDEVLSPADIESLREWLDRSPVHREELADLISLYGKMNVLTELAVPLGTAPPATERNRSPGHPAYRWAAAAAVVVAVVAAVAVTNRPTEDPLLSANGSYATSVGEQQTITLADESAVQLNTSTRLEVEYGDSFRNVHLRSGEAYFTVAKHPGRPFRVYAGGGRIEAVGTAFAVHLQDDDVDVTVAEGKVALSLLRQPHEPGASHSPRDGTVAPDNDAGSIRTLTAGQGSVIKDTGTSGGVGHEAAITVRTIERQELDRQLSWRKGLLVFAGEPLEQVVDEISRYTTMTIDIDDPAVRAISIGGQFRVGDTDALLGTLESNFDLRVTRLGFDHVQLSSAPAPPDSGHR